MQTESIKTWLESATRYLSFNCDKRPPHTQIDLLVIHNISLPPEQFEGDYVEQFFRNRLNPNTHPYFKDIAHLCVSSHLYIKRDGTLIQFVPLYMRAWHAGDSCWEGRSRCNDYSIGIEMEGSDFQAFEDAQYETLAEVTRDIMQQYPEITADRIVGHSDIAPDRKTDPGDFFDWKRYLALASSEGSTFK